MDQQIIPSSRVRRSRKQIEDLLKEFESTGLAARDFCQSRQINRISFDKWLIRYRYQDSGQQNSSAFAAIRVNHHTDQLLFAEVKGVKIYQPVSATFLKELMA